MEIPCVFDDDLSPLDMLTDSLKLLSNDYLPGVAASDLGARCVSLQHARQQLDALMATTVAEADRGGVATNAGTSTMAQYLAARTHMSPDAARADLRVGIWVSSYAQLEAAMLDGRLSRQHSDRIRKLENIRVASAMLRDQHLFVQWANDLEWRSFAKTCAYWLLVNDQDDVSNFVRTSLLALGGQNAHTVPRVACIRTMRTPSARGERSSRSDHVGLRGCRPAVSTCGR